MTETQTVQRSRAGARRDRVAIRQSEVLSALSFALDITEGQPEGHSVRTCMIGMTLADELGLSVDRRSALFYALLLKDLGCSSNAAKVCYLFGSDDHVLKRRLKLTDWSNLIESAKYALRSAAERKPFPQRVRHIILLGMKGPAVARDLVKIRCERGADIARMLDFPPATADAIRALDEHWDGRGHPAGLSGEDIPLLGRILGLAQTVDVFFHEHGPQAAAKIVAERRGTWFDPKLCDLFSDALANDADFWQRLSATDVLEHIGDYEPSNEVLLADQAALDRIAGAFAKVIDAKSPYTYCHSERVAQIADQIAEELGFGFPERNELARAALLHDIGKLGVSNLILDKEGELDEQEWQAIRRHPAYTYSILQRVNGFNQFADLASAHHERLDGKGYHRGTPATDLDMPARALALADKYEALTAARPYRGPMGPERALKILQDDVGEGVDPAAFAALRVRVEAGLVPSPTELPQQA